MLNNFHLTVLVSERGRDRLNRMPLHRTLQRTLSRLWHDQLQSFTNEVQHVNFDPGYIPENHERFVLEDFLLPECLIGVNSGTIRNLDPINMQQEYTRLIKAVVGFARDENGGEVILFQNFTKSHVVMPGRFLFLQGDTFETTENPGLTLDTKLAAVYWTEESKLLFRNFRSTNTFLPLADFYEEATEQEIHEILAHEKLAPENADVIATGANQWFSKRFAMLRDSGVLDNYTVRQIAEHSRAYEVDIQIDNRGGVEKIVFPEERVAAKKLLQFLNEELFRGAITDRLFETNSKREAD